jgi:hypothetical protein
MERRCSFLAEAWKVSEVSDILGRLNGIISEKKLGFQEVLMEMSLRELSQG